MSIEQAKTAALEALLQGPFTPDPTDTRAPAIHLLKAEGVPIVSREVKQDGKLRMQHRMIETALQPNEIRARRQEGLAMGLTWHRHEKPIDWPALVRSIPCPFAQDEAKQYLAGITLRARYIGH
jgi:hypothetical protein